MDEPLSKNCWGRGKRKLIGRKEKICNDSEGKNKEHYGKPNSYNCATIDEIIDEEVKNNERGLDYPQMSLTRSFSLSSDT